MEKNFSLYLIKIGLFDENTLNDIFKYNNNFKNKTFADISFYYLMNFFDKLTENQKKYMSYCIPTNYKINIANIRKRKLKSIFIQLLLRQKLLLLKCINIWKRNSIIFDNSLNNDKLTKILHVSQNSLSLDDYLGKNNFKRNIYNNKKKNKEKNSNINDIYNSLNIKMYKSKNERSLNRIYKYQNKKANENQLKYELDDYNTFKKKKPNFNYIFRNLYQSKFSKKDENKLLTSLETKELNELKECTFKPRINKSSPKKKNTSNSKEKEKNNLQSTFDKLFHDEEKYKLSKELKTIDRDNNLGKTFSFTPNISNKFKNIYKNNKNFVERQNYYNEKVSKKREDLNNEINSKCELICSFSPKITNEKGEYYRIKKNEELNKNLNKPVFKRLYEDMNKRRNYKEQKELENINKFNEMANQLTIDKKIDESIIIERLYEKNKDDKLNKLREKVEKEEGITFKPEIEENGYMKNIEGTFLERNEKFIEDRKNYLEQEKERHLENLRNSENKKYTNEEREQIISNIIERLYKIKNKNKNESQNENEEEESANEEENVNEEENENEEE